MKNGVVAASFAATTSFPKQEIGFNAIPLECPASDPGVELAAIGIFPCADSCPGPKCFGPGAGRGTWRARPRSTGCECFPLSSGSAQCSRPCDPWSAAGRKGILGQRRLDLWARRWQSYRRSDSVPALGQSSLRCSTERRRENRSSCVLLSSRRTSAVSNAQWVRVHRAIRVQEDLHRLRRRTAELARHLHGRASSTERE